MPSDPTPRPNPSPAGKPRRRPAPGGGGNWVWMLILLVLVGMFLVNNLEPSGAIEWGEFYSLINDPKDSKNIKKVVFRGTDQILIEIADPKQLPDDLEKRLARGNRFNVTRPEVREDKELVGRLEALARRDKIDPETKKPYEVDPETKKPKDQPPAALHWEQQGEQYTWLKAIVFLVVLPAVVLLAVFLFLLPRFRDPMGGGFLSNYIKSPAKRYERTKQRITFDDVAGTQNAKSELQEIVEFLRSPEKFQRLGAVVPKGVLLVGPPGTGKTLLAKAVAGEAGVPFFSISGSEFIQMFVGVGASRVRDMFKTAKENAPCILFIDEIDAVGRMRGAGVGGGSDEREQTLNQILSEMDGFQPTETVIVVAATNRPDVLDSALLRPGRFDRHITIDRPTWQGRLAILKVHTRNKPLADEVNLEAIARNVIGMTGADLRNLANEAALLATREGKSKIERQDFERAADRVLMGPKREEVLTEDAKRRTAYHEAGHAVVSYYEPEADPPQKVTIVPRGRTGGVTMFAPDEERMHHSMQYFKARLTMAMGGRAAERLVYGQPFAGAENDLKQATRLARYMVTHWGMSDKLGPMSFRVGEEHVFLGKEIQEPRDFSEATAAIIDEEVQRLLREADQRAHDLLQNHRDQMERLVEALLQREELLKEEIDALLRESNGQVTATPVGQLIT